jgi:hypothetical protein
LENQLCKVGFDLGKEETVSRVCSRHKKGAKTRDTILKKKINQKRSCEITKGGERQGSVDKEDSKSSKIMSSNDESDGSNTNLSKGAIEIFSKTYKKRVMRYKNDISNERCSERRTDMVGDAKRMEKANVNAKNW